MHKILSRLDAHVRFLLALVVSCGAFVLTIGRLEPAVQAIAVWNAFAWSVIVLAWSLIILADARTSVQTAKLQDTARSMIFLFVILGAVISLSAVAILVGGAKGMSHKALTEHLLLAGTTVASSWFLIHTVFTMHYAHAYYRDDDPDERGRHGAGLNFPGEEDDEPDFIDFAY